MDLDAMMARIAASHQEWREGLAGTWPPPRITRRLKAVAQALVRAECAPGLWQADETEKRVRREWRKYLWQAAVALHAAERS